MYVPCIAKQSRHVSRRITMATVTTTTPTQWPAAPATNRTRLTTALVWTAQLGAAAIFLMAGLSKLTGAEAMVQAFAAIGIGQWFRYLTGTIEVVSAVLLLIPSLALFGALALIPTMVGAIVTHLFILGGSPAVPVVLLAATGYIAYVRGSRR
jgi:putative oxidoreductase